MDDRHRPGFETLCIHFAEDREANLGAAAPPLYQCSTFTYPTAEHFEQRRTLKPARYIYTRESNPTTLLLERKIAELEGAESARAYSSGMAAISAAILSCVRSGDHVVCIETVYGPTRRLLSDYLPKFGIETTYVRGTEVSDFETALRPNTKLIYVESPSSLLFELQDLTAVSKLARSRNIATICDNSNATPYFQNPVALGIDVVVHTATKYIGGHSDLVAGFVAGANERMQSMAAMEGELLGGVADPFSSWLMLRGLRTLGVRLDRHYKNAMAIARFLESDARIGRVYYDGLESHPQAYLARKQMRGHSGMLSFTLRDGGRDQVYAVVNALQYFCIAVSWGGYESLALPLEVTNPASGRKEWIIRLSVGLESVEDLKADLYLAFNRAFGRQ
ncbi:MAG TPA: PLP-dependent aspartate aminotransferase family protein [Phycisphaerae bacterium]|nr:PLP-dependent aspartate aminotransferase family protein [Phycisphaerae bacterium]